MARWKANEKLHKKVAKISSTRNGFLPITENSVLGSVCPDGHNFCIRTWIATFFGSLESKRKVTSESSKDQLYVISVCVWNPSVPVSRRHFPERRVPLMRTSLPCVQPTLLTMDLNLCPCKVQSQELVHVNSSIVRGPKRPFCVAFEIGRAHV